MKNLLSLILAITLILSLAACGATPAPAAPEPSSTAPAAPEEPPTSPPIEKEKNQTTVRVAPHRHGNGEADGGSRSRRNSQ